MVDGGSVITCWNQQSLFARRDSMRFWLKGCSDVFYCLYGILCATAFVPRTKCCKCIQSGSNPSFNK